MTPLRVPVASVLVILGAVHAPAAHAPRARATGAAASRAVVADTLALRYDITLPRGGGAPSIEIRLTLPASDDTVTALLLPDEWAGSSGLYREIEELAAVTPGARLESGGAPFRKLVRHERGEPVVLRWLVRPSWSEFIRGSQTRSAITPGWVQVIGRDALVLPDAGHERPVRATFRFHGVAGGGVATSFGSGDTVIVARARLHELAHAVYTAGELRLHRLAVEGRRVSIAVHGLLGFGDDRLVSALERIVAAERAFWRDRGPDHYLVTVAPAPRGTLAGTRLTNSFVAYLDAGRPLDDGVLALLAHELMHEWIGGRLHAAPGYRRGEMYWFTEGFDDFYTQRILHRAGLISDSAFLAAVNRAIVDYTTSPVRNAPYDVVERRYWTDHDVGRVPYLRGHLLALRLDHLIGHASRGARSLDDVMRRLLRAAEDDDFRGVNDSVVVAALAPELGARTARREIQAHIREGRTIVLDPEILGPCFRGTPTRVAAFDVGFDLDRSMRDTVVRGVRAGSAAHRAGLRDGMRLRGWSVHHGDPGRPAEFAVIGGSGAPDRWIRYLPAANDGSEVVLFMPAEGCEANE